MSIPSEPSSLAGVKAPISQEALDQLFRAPTARLRDSFS
jgi:hypothetical protein